MILVSTINYSCTEVGQSKMTSKWAPFNQSKAANIPLTMPGIYILPVNGQGIDYKFS